MKTETNKLKTAINSTVLAASLVVAPMAFADGNEAYKTDEKLKDAWLDGKVETALLINRHLNNFTIDTEVKNNVAYLSGTVKSEIDRALAAEIASGIEGVTSVDNDIIVKKDYQSIKGEKHASHNHQVDKTRSFGTWYDDTTTTASIKSDLLWNDETSGLDVNVDTVDGTVTLNGVVETAAEKSLIEEIANNTPGVRHVDSEIEIDSNS